MTRREESAKAQKGGEGNMAVIYLAALILLCLGLVIVINRYRPVERGMACRVCGKAMQRSWISWSYPLPFEIWAVVAHYQLQTAILVRYVCPDKHTQAWYIPRFGDRQVEVLVTKTLHKD